MNPYDKDGNDSHGYVCQDCRYYQSGRCTEEDEGGEICTRFELPRRGSYTDYDEEVQNEGI